MADGKIVISDRYFYSCLANLRARGFEQDRWIYEIAESIVKPDIAFFFDVSVDTAVARVRSRAAEKDRYIDMDLQYRLRSNYIDICKANGGVLISTEAPEDEWLYHNKTNSRKGHKKMNAREIVYSILENLSCAEEIQDEDHLQYHLGLDSLSMITLLIELEDTLDVEFDQSDLNPFDLQNVEDVIKLAERYSRRYGE